MKDFKNIDLNTELLKGNTIYVPIEQKYYEIEDIGYQEIYQEVIVNLKPKKNSNKNGFTIRLSHVVHFGYKLVFIS